MRRGHRQALDAYALHLRRRNLAAGTQANLIAGATRFLATAAHGLRRLQRSDVRAFLATRSLALQPSTLVAEASRVRCFLAWAAAEGLAPEGLAEAISVPNPPKRQRRVLSEAAVARLLRAASWSTCPTALRDRACLEILYGLGLRASEVAAVRVLDLDLAEGTLQVRPAKRGPPRVLPLPRAALPHLATYLREARPWLVRLERDRGHLLVSRMGLPLTNRNVCRLVTRLGRAADASWVRPHDLRRALATHLVRRGVSVLAVVDLLGHSDVGACEPYLVSLAPLPRVTDHPSPSRWYDPHQPGGHVDFDFRGADRVDWSQVPPERRGANHFQSTELFARQLLYDLSYSVPHSGHEVRRHKDLEYGFARHQVGIRVALVYLVAQLDGDLNAAFETLWDRRPTLLHERLSKDDLLSKGLTLKLQHV